MIQLLFVWMGLGLSSYVAALLTLGVNAMAYMAEAIRAGLLSIPPGQLTAAQALGLTPLLNCMARFRQPKSGRILLDGADICDIPEIEFRSRVGVIFQNLNLFPYLNILENMILAPCNVRHEPRDQAVCAAQAMFERLGIAQLAGNYPSQVSGGQAQRAVIARELMLKPNYLLLDEPTSALDRQTTCEFASWLLELQGDTTFVIVTHDLDFSQQVASHGVILADGNVTRQGPMNEIIDKNQENQEQ